MTRMSCFSLVIMVALAMSCGQGSSGLTSERSSPATNLSAMALSQEQQAVTYSNHEYLFVTSHKTWNEAQSYCRSAGNYNLATINNVYEESWLNSQEASLSGYDWWIGYTDQGSEGTWRWLSGSSSTYTNWSRWNPDNYTGGPSQQQNCATDNYSYGMWDDADCLSLHPFVCEEVHE